MFLLLGGNMLEGTVLQSLPEDTEEEGGDESGKQ